MSAGPALLGAGGIGPCLQKLSKGFSSLSFTCTRLWYTKETLDVQHRYMHIYGGTCIQHAIKHGHAREVYDRFLALGLPKRDAWLACVRVHNCISDSAAPLRFRRSGEIGIAKRFLIAGGVSGVNGNGHYENGAERGNRTSDIAEWKSGFDWLKASSHRGRDNDNGWSWKPGQESGGPNDLELGKARRWVQMVALVEESYFEQFHKSAAGGFAIAHARALERATAANNDFSHIESTISSNINSASATASSPTTALTPHALPSVSPDLQFRFLDSASPPPSSHHAGSSFHSHNAFQSIDKILLENATTASMEDGSGGGDDGTGNGYKKAIGLIRPNQDNGSRHREHTHQSKAKSQDHPSSSGEVGPGVESGWQYGNEAGGGSGCGWRWRNSRQHRRGRTWHHSHGFGNFRTAGFQWQQGAGRRSGHSGSSSGNTGGGRRDRGGRYTGCRKNLVVQAIGPAGGEGRLIKKRRNPNDTEEKPFDFKEVEALRGFVKEFRTAVSQVQYLKQKTQAEQFVTSFMASKSQLYAPTSIGVRGYHSSVSTSSSFFPTNGFQSCSLSKPIEQEKKKKKVVSEGNYCPFHTLSASFGLPPLPVLLKPFLAFLKSPAAMKASTAISRISLSLMPLSKLLADSRFTPYFKYAFTIALLPLFLLLITAVSGLERTPVSGRWRMILLSDEEETELVDGVLSSSPVIPPDVYGYHRDWVPILKRVMGEPGEEYDSTSTLLGARILDPEADWRVGWATSVLRSLEVGGIPALYNGVKDLSKDDQKSHLHPPPLDFPLRSRGQPYSTQDHPLAIQPYDLLLVDRPETNAFSFGFGPGEVGDVPSTRGVIVLFTGFIDSILGLPPGGSDPSQRYELGDKSSSFNPFGMLASSILGHSSKPPSYSHNGYEIPLPPPDMVPTQAQTDSLAVLLSHELAHLLLSHTLESFSSNGTSFIKEAGKLGTDIIRSVTYPFTIFLGPFFQEALGQSARVFWADDFDQSLGTLSAACLSRGMEVEADLVGLRLLAGAGVEPTRALTFWEERMAADSKTFRSEDDFSALSRAVQRFNLHSSPNQGHREEYHRDDMNREKGTGSHCACREHLLRFHPVEKERLARIKGELQKWARTSGQALESLMGGQMSKLMAGT